MVRLLAGAAMLAVVTLGVTATSSVIGASEAHAGINKFAHFGAAPNVPLRPPPPPPPPPKRKR